MNVPCASVEADALRATEYAPRSTVPDLSGCFRIREFGDGGCVWIKSDDDEPEVMSFDEADPSSSLPYIVSLCCSNDTGFGRLPTFRENCVPRSSEPLDGSSFDETATPLTGRVVEREVAAAEFDQTPGR